MIAERIWLPYLQLVRIPNAFTAVSNSLAAHLIATGGQIRWGSLLLLMLASAFLYSGGMVFNDCFDYEEDRRDRPFRPLPSGRVPISTAWLLGGLLLALGVVSAGMVGETQLYWALALAALIFIYDGLAKGSAVGALAMGGCRYLNWVLGLSIVDLDGALLSVPFVILIYVISLTRLSSIETSGFSRRPIVQCIVGVIGAALLLVGLVMSGTLPHAWPLVLLVLALWSVLRELIATYREPTPESVQRSVKSLVLGIIPLDALLAFCGGPWWGGVLVLFFVLPSRLLARHIRVT
ncbi:MULTISPECIES: UbiA family prenyltransferase [unclassified Methylocaldum]|uniref:UbiA family prenyltransferase n=1 Tax=Methylocaldum sp. RMAD-M TaxID=2806557 RepID=UPI000A323B8A|nr:4-hydroxybenzoate polyprenyltransferase [Methylocaldum sp. RMAD-M]